MAILVDGIRKLINPLSLVIFSLALTACDGGSSADDSIIRGPDQNNATPDFTDNSTNETLVTGGPIGNNSASVGEMRKKILFTLTNSDPRLDFDGLYIARTSLSSDYIYWTMFARNITTDQIFCFVKLQNGVYLDSAGQVLAEDSIDYVSGNVRKIGSLPVTSDTCLLPGSRGVFTGIDNIPGGFSNIVELNYELVSITDNATTEPLLSHVVHGGVYHVVDSVNELYEFNLPVSNIGSADASLAGTFSKYVVVDQDEQPLAWGYLSLVSGWDGNLAVNGENNLRALNFLNRSADRIYVYLDYEDAMVTQNSLLMSAKDITGNPDAYETIKQIKDLRNLNESYKQSLVEP